MIGSTWLPDRQFMTAGISAATNRYRLERLPRPGFLPLQRRQVRSRGSLQVILCVGYGAVFPLFNVVYRFGRRDPGLRFYVKDGNLNPDGIVFGKQAQMLALHLDFGPESTV
jgi:hypothetical protein